MADETDPNIVNRLNRMPPFVDEEPQAAPEEVPVEEKPQEVPQEEPQPEPEPVPEPEVTKDDALANSKNPERTKKYIEKLEEQNKVLRKNILDSLIPEPAPMQPEPPAFQPMTPPVYPQPQTTNRVPTPQQFPGLSQNQIKETFQGLIDDQGYVDSGLLIQTLNDLREKNRIAEERARQAEEKTDKVVKKFDDFERNETMRKVHEKYPTLNPENPEFDERLWKFVRNEVVDQWVNGKMTDVEAAAREGVEILYGNEMKKAEKEKQEQAEIAKRNINALGASNTTQRESYSDRDALVRATQFGKRGALAERLRKSGY